MESLLFGGYSTCHSASNWKEMVNFSNDMRLDSMVFFSWFFVGGVHGSFMGIIGLIATQFSLFLICSYAFYKSGSIVGQIFLLGVVVALA
jgi:hypothetical protein